MKTEITSATEVSVMLDATDFETIQWVQQVRKEFSKLGFKVSERAIMHNYNAWAHDYKSGYRDDGGGYHLFTPCGCNPLSFRLTALSDDSKDWQTTYIV